MGATASSILLQLCASHSHAASPGAVAWHQHITKESWASARGHWPKTRRRPAGGRRRGHSTHSHVQALHLCYFLWHTHPQKPLCFFHPRPHFLTCGHHLFFHASRLVERGMLPVRWRRVAMRGRRALQRVGFAGRFAPLATPSHP